MFDNIFLISSILGFITTFIVYFIIEYNSSDEEKNKKSMAYYILIFIIFIIIFYLIIYIYRVNVIFKKGGKLKSISKKISSSDIITDNPDW